MSRELISGELTMLIQIKSNQYATQIDLKWLFYCEKGGLAKIISQKVELWMCSEDWNVCYTKNGNHQWSNWNVLEGRRSMSRTIENNIVLNIQQ
jgi:hypothetical protein